MSLQDPVLLTSGGNKTCGSPFYVLGLCGESSYWYSVGKAIRVVILINTSVAFRNHRIVRLPKEEVSLTKWLSFLSWLWLFLSSAPFSPHHRLFISSRYRSLSSPTWLSLRLIFYIMGKMEKGLSQFFLGGGEAIKKIFTEHLLSTR